MNSKKKIAEQNSPPTEGLGQVISDYLEKYFETLGQNLNAGNLYDIVLQEVERPLLEITLKTCDNNQKKAAEVLGINRNTLRRKLTDYSLIH